MSLSAKRLIGWGLILFSIVMIISAPIAFTHIVGAVRVMLVFSVCLIVGIRIVKSANASEQAVSPKNEDKEAKTPTTEDILEQKRWLARMRERVD